METKVKRNARLKAMRKKYHLGEFGKKKKTSRAKPRRITVKKRRKSGRVKMAKRRTTRRAKAKSMTSSLMSGVFKPKGMIAAVVLGMGAAALANYIPLNVPYKEEIAAGLVGGIPAAGAVFALKQLPSINLGTISSGGYVAGY